MPRLSQETREAEVRPWADQRRQDAAALFQRFGADGVAWLDRAFAEIWADVEGRLAAIESAA